MEEPLFSGMIFGLSWGFYQSCKEIEVLSIWESEELQQWKKPYSRMGDGEVIEVQLLNQVKEELSFEKKTWSGKKNISLWRNKAGYKSQFSSKETWHLMREDREECSWFKGVWFSKAAPKFAFITWLAMLDRLSTIDRVSRWINGVDQKCVICNSSPETRDHMFFDC